MIAVSHPCEGSEKKARALTNTDSGNPVSKDRSAAPTWLASMPHAAGGASRLAAGPDSGLTPPGWLVDRLVVAESREPSMGDQAINRTGVRDRPSRWTMIP